MNYHTNAGSEMNSDLVNLYQRFRSLLAQALNDGAAIKEPETLDKAFIKEITLSVAKNEIEFPYNDLLAQVYLNLTEELGVTEAALQLIASTNTNRSLPQHIREHAISKYPRSFFINPLIIESSYEEHLYRLMECLLVSPKDCIFCFNNTALATRADVMSVVTKAWDRNIIDGQEFAKLLANTTEEALPNFVLDRLFSLFTDPENINPPWREAVAMLNNTNLTYSRDQITKLLQSADPELYLIGLEREDDLLTWQDWKTLSTALKDEVGRRFDRNNSPLATLNTLTNRIQRTALERIEGKYSKHLFNDLELLDWFLTGPDEVAQSVAAKLLIQDHYETPSIDTSPSESLPLVDHLTLTNAMILLAEKRERTHAL